jgi:hypothetical protein
MEKKIIVMLVSDKLLKTMIDEYKDETEKPFRLIDLNLVKKNKNKKVVDVIRELVLLT